jgi:chaperone required for assembly of F1-ATPase
MRDFLEEAYEHRQDGYGRAQAANKQPLLKRFYKAVTVAPAEGGFAILLDGKNMKTPGGKPVHVPTEALAEAMAREWEAQATEIDFRAMPLVRLAHSAIESGAEGAGAFRDEIVKYAGNDLLLYRADTPDSLVREQEAAWGPVLVALAGEHGVTFRSTTGIIHQPQPEATLLRLAETLAGEDHFALAALMQMVSLTGSALLTLAYRGGLIDSATVWTAAHVDEDYNIRLWGEDDEAARRRAQRFVEFSAAVDMLKALAR